MGAAHYITLKLQCESHSRNSKVPGAARPDFAVGALQIPSGRREHDFGHYLFWLHDSLARNVLCRQYEEILYRNASLSFRAFDVNLRAICDEGRSCVGRVDNVASLSSKDAVVMILALDRKAAVPSFSEAMEFSTIVPTTRLLTEIAA